MKNFMIPVLLFLFINPLIIYSAGDSSGYKRTKWFYSQRYAPYDTISENFMQNALTERDYIRSGGYYMNPAAGTWENLSGFTGRINTVKYAGNNIFVIGAPNGGIWKKSGTVWTYMDPNGYLKSNTSGAIGVDNSTEPPTIYYGTGEGIYGFVYAYLGNGIYKTTNWGDSWSHISNGLGSNMQIFRITIRPNYPSHVFAATSKGLFRSTNSGNNWSVVSGTSGLHCNDIVFSSQNEYKAFMSGPKSDDLLFPCVGFRTSTDGGETFTVYTGDDFQPIGRTHIAVYENDDDYIYAITQDGIISVFVSTNGGESFHGPYNCNTSSQGGYNMLLNISLDDPSIIYVGGIDLFKSTDYGVTFNEIGASMHDDFHHMAINPDNYNEIAVVNDGGIYFSLNNGVSWSNANTGLPLMNTYRMINPGYRIVAGNQDNGFVRRETSNFEIGMWAFGDGTNVINSKIQPNIVIGITGNTPGSIHLSTNGGIDRNSLIDLPGKWDGGNDWLGAICEHPVDAGYFYTARRNAAGNIINIWRSTNYGLNWATIGNGVSALKSPQNIVFSTKDPDIVYMSTSGYSGPYWNEQYFGRGFFKSENGGITWSILIQEDDEETLPFNYITRVITSPAENPAKPDEVYITLSGFYQGTNEGHVFKSTNEGNNWININGNLPNTPVNDLIIWNSGTCSENQKNLSVATDIGIFNSTNNGITWLELAEGLPLSPVIDIDYLPYLKIMRAATFGMGVWQVNLDGDIYITDNENLPSGVTIDKNIIVCNGGVLNFVGGAGTVKFTQGKQITVLNGGKITGNSNATFYGDGVSWNGIVIEPGGEADLDNCFFDQTSTPITINGDAFVSSPQVNITNCTFFCNNAGVGAININNRNNVIIENNTWAYPNNSNLQRIAINTINSSDLLINNNQFNFNTLEDANFSAISVDYGNNVIISNNKIYKLAKGITILNCSPFVFRNEIIYPLTPSIFQSYGITLSNSYSSNLKQNIITNYGTGIKLQNSSPLLFENDFINNLEEATALVCETNSSPRLRPQESGGQTIWDAGKNNFEALFNEQNINYGVGLNIANYSFPDLEFGCNTINTSSYTFSGHIAYCIGAYHYLFARHNIWNNYSENICDADWETFPPGCYEGSGGSEKENEPPPQPIVINYGNGIYDTIQITNRNVQVNTDQALYLSANNDEITGNYLSAVIKYEQVIQDYQDSLTALNSLRKLLHCRDIMNSDTTAYSQLRSYFQGRIQSNLTDTVFVNVAEELAAKCLVRMGKPTNAIDEYEVIISNTNDSSKILCAELNIIETYLIIQNSGDSPNYTGQLGYLKPATKEDAYKKIMDRLHKNKKDKSNNTIPKVFKLSQNYPNPFNPITKINYSLPRAVKVNIQVYDILGRLVKTLVNENKEAGNYEVQFDGTGLASGVYFYRIEAGDFADSKKMVLVK